MANIADDTNLIRTATYGKDMREAIADGIEDINAEVESTTARQTTVEGRQDDVENTFQEVINLGGNPSAEVVQARTDTVNSITYDNLQARMDGVASSLAEKQTQLNNISIDVKYPQSPLSPAVLDGVTDDTTRINAIISSAPINATILINGNAKVLSTIVMKSNITVICKGSIIGGSQINIIDFTNASDSAWIGGNIVGDGVTVAQNGFNLTNASRNRIAPLSISNCKNKAITVIAQSSNSQVARDNYISPIKVTGSNSTTGAGISLFGDTCESNIINKPYCTSNRIGITINGSHRNRVIAPNCSGNTDMGLTIDGVITDSGDGGKYNEIICPICNSNTPSTSYGGIYLGNGSSYNKIISPICNSNAGAGIRMSATQGTNDCVGNVIQSPNCESNSTIGMNISGSARTIINTPLVKNNTGKGIVIFKSDYSQVIGGESTGNTEIGLIIQSGYSKTLGTTITGNGTGGYQVASGGSTDSTGNIITGGAYVSGNTSFDFNVGGGLGYVGDVLGNTQKIKTDAGDATFSYSAGKETIIIYNTPITAARPVTLATTGTKNGDKVRVVRNANCTGAFNVNVGTGPLKALTAAGQWCDVEYNGSAWVLSAYGAL